MRLSGLVAVLVLPGFAFAGASSNSYSDPSGYSYSYSSEDFGGASSYLGVDTKDVTPDRLSALGLKEEHGVEVTMVDQDAPAGKAGVKEQDVILSVNGTQIESVEQLRRVIHEIPPGRMVALGILRQGQSLTLRAQLSDRTKDFAYSQGPKNFKFTMPAMPNMPAYPMPEMDLPVSVVIVHSAMHSGLMVENLTPQLGEFLGARNGQGVLVRSVEKGSLAEKAGFRAGDVIVKVNGEAVSDAADFSHALRGRKDNAANVGIIRDKKPQTITFTLPPQRQTGQSILEESFELPTLRAEEAAQLSEVRQEVARLQPELQSISSEIKDVMAKARPEMERAQTAAKAERAKIQKQMRELERQMRRQNEALPVLKMQTDI